MKTTSCTNYTSTGWKTRTALETRRFSDQLDELLQTEHEFSIHDSDYAWDQAAVDEEDTKDDV